MRMQLGVRRSARQNGRTGRSRILRTSLVGGAALVVGLATALCTSLPADDPAHRPPPFSRRIVSAFPDLAFTTCELGHFTESASEPQRWYVRPTSRGELAIEVRALGASLTESGALSARLLDRGGTSLAEGSVPYPTGALPGSERAVALRAAAAPDAIYPLEILRVPPAVGGEAHHYRLGFSGVHVEVGMPSPALRWLEGRNGGPQVFHVNVDDGEALQLSITAGEGQPVPFLTVEARSEEGVHLHETTSRTWDPFDVTLEPGGARTLRIVTFGNHHFMLDKRSGRDRGIYFDACPPQGWSPPRG